MGGGKRARPGHTHGVRRAVNTFTCYLCIRPATYELIFKWYLSECVAYSTRTVRRTQRYAKIGTFAVSTRVFPTRACMGGWYVPSGEIIGWLVARTRGCAASSRPEQRDGCCASTPPGRASFAAKTASSSSACTRSLEANLLSGTIPLELGSLSRVISLNLFGNQLSGTIPPELGSLFNVGYLILGGNQLSGTIPHELGSLFWLGYLGLDSNQLSGTIPLELGSLPYLYWLTVADNPRICGAAPASLPFVDMAGTSGPMCPFLWLLPDPSQIELDRCSGFMKGRRHGEDEGNLTIKQSKGACQAYQEFVAAMDHEAVLKKIPLTSIFTHVGRRLNKMEAAYNHEEYADTKNKRAKTREERRAQMQGAVGGSGYGLTPKERDEWEIASIADAKYEGDNIILLIDFQGCLCCKAIKVIGVVTLRHNAATNRSTPVYVVTLPQAVVQKTKESFNSSESSKAGKALLSKSALIPLIAAFSSQNELLRHTERHFHKPKVRLYSLLDVQDLFPKFQCPIQDVPARSIYTDRCLSLPGMRCQKEVLRQIPACLTPSQTWIYLNKVFISQNIVNFIQIGSRNTAQSCSLTLLLLVRLVRSASAAKTASSSSFHPQESDKGTRQVQTSISTWHIRLRPALPAQVRSSEDKESAIAIPPLGSVGATTTLTGDTSQYLRNVEFACTGMPFAGPDMVYSYTPLYPQTLQIDTCDSSFDTVLKMESADGGTFWCNDDSPVDQRCMSNPLGSKLSYIPVVAGVKYYIFVKGYSENDKGWFNLTLKVIELGGQDKGNAITIPPLDSVGATTTLPGDTSPYLSNNRFACYDGWEPFAGPDMVYSYTPLYPQTLQIDTCDSSFDTVLKMESADGDGTIWCNDDSPVDQPCTSTNPFGSKLSYIPVVAGVKYYIFVKGYSENDKGWFNLRLKVIELADPSLPTAPVAPPAAPRAPPSPRSPPSPPNAPLSPPRPPLPALEPVCIQITNTDNTVGNFTDSYNPTSYNPTHWNRTLAVSQFDQGCGTLQSVSIHFTGRVTGTAKFESTENRAAAVTLTVSAEISLQSSAAAGGAALLTVHPQESRSKDLTVFDKRADFGGESGITALGFSATGEDQTTLTTDISEFISRTYGTAGEVFFPTSARATSQAVASGRNIHLFYTKASAAIKVLYTFTSASAPGQPVCSQSTDADGTVKFTDSIGAQMYENELGMVLSASEFDRGCGTLRSVSISLTGEINDRVQFYISDPKPSVTLNVSAEITIRRSSVAGGAALLIVNPQDSKTAPLTYSQGQWQAVVDGFLGTATNQTTLTSDIAGFNSVRAGTVRKVFFPTIFKKKFWAEHPDGYGESYPVVNATIAVRYTFISQFPPAQPDAMALLAFKAGVAYPPEFQGLDNWVMGIEPCEWRGITCSDLYRVTEIDLSNWGLSGTLSPALGNLTYLSNINLSNNSISGTIPGNWLLRQMETLQLDYNVISGTIPPSVLEWAALQVLSLTDNRLSGTIPGELARLNNLDLLAVAGNPISGCLPLLNNVEFDVQNTNLNTDCAHSIDALALLAFKAGIASTSEFHNLDNWVNGINPCEWAAVLCNNFGRVTGLVSSCCMRSAHASLAILAVTRLPGATFADPLKFLRKSRILASYWLSIFDNGNHAMVGRQPPPLQFVPSPECTLYTILIRDTAFVRCKYHILASYGAV
eukprot:jgi/Mesvir1/15758/Mv03330-RA.1